MSSTEQKSDKDRYVSRRMERAENRYLRLMCDTGGTDTTYLVQKHDGCWRDAHRLFVEGSSVVDCSCPDRQERGKERSLPCYHMLAWEYWTFDEMLWPDGTEESLTERERQ